MATPTPGLVPQPGRGDFDLAPYGLPLAEAPVEQEIPLSYYWLLLRRNAWRILTFATVVPIAVALYTLNLPKQYESVAVVRIDTTGAPIVGQTERATGGADATIIVETEEQVVTGSAIISNLIDTLHLDQLSEFNKNIRGTDPGDVQRAQLIRQVAAHIAVSHPIGTLLLEIHFRSMSPLLAAQAANGLAQAFLEQEYNTRAQALTDSSRSMMQQLDQLRATMEQDQLALMNYETTNNVLDPDSKDNIAQSGLSQINEDLGKAEAERIRLQAEHETAAMGNVGGILASERGPELVPFQQRLTQDQALLEKMGGVDGPNHPLYVQQQAVVSNDQAALLAQERAIAGEIEEQYRTALERETLDRQEVQKQQGALESFDRKAIGYRNLKTAADNSTHLYYELQQQIQDSNVAANLRTEELRLINPARANYIPVAPRVTLATALSFLLALFFGIIAAVATGVLDHTIATAEQVEHWFHVPVIGNLPQATNRTDLNMSSLENYGLGLVAGTGAANLETKAGYSKRSSFREMILTLCSSILFAGTDNLVAMGFSSAIPGEGKSTVACHVAAALAGLGHTVVLVDADMRRPNVHRVFGTTNHFGLSDVLADQTNLTRAVVPVRAIENFSILPAGPAPKAPAQALHVALGGTIDQLRKRFRFILIDCPPVLGFADALAVASTVDGMLMVVKAGETDRDLVGGALRQFRSVRANLMGIIINQVNSSINAYYAYHGYYSKYYHNDEAGIDPRGE